MIIKDYYGNPVAIPLHVHTIADTQRNGVTAMATDTEDGFMNKTDIGKIDTLTSKANEIDRYIQQMLYVKTAILLTSNAFRGKLVAVGPNATSIIFTKTAIPADKIATASLVSIASSKFKVYMYLDGTTIYVSPESDGVVMFCTDCYRMFYNLMKVTTIDMTNFDFSRTTSVNGMFQGCSTLTTLKVSFKNTSALTDMNHMFNGCSTIRSLDLSELNTSNVDRMSYTFNNCTRLVSIGSVNFDFTKVTTTSYMFYGCSWLTQNLTINSGNIGSYTNMLRDCSTISGTLFTVNYTADAQVIAPKIVATKGTTSNIVLGTLIN